MEWRDRARPVSRVDAGEDLAAADVRPMNPTPADWTRVKAIFDGAVVLESGARSAYLEERCGTDARLRQQVEALLASHDLADTFLETPAAALIARSDDELIGRTVDSYHIVARLGAGGMDI